MSFASIFMNIIINEAATRKGPNGIILSFLEKRKNSDDGSAIKADKASDAIETNGAFIIPSIPISFISPPPKDSSLNKKFPSFIIRYININIKSPYRK